MPTTKQLQNAKKKLKKTPKASGNTPKIANAALKRLIAADTTIRRNNEFLKRDTQHSTK